MSSSPLMAAALAASIFSLVACDDEADPTAGTPTDTPTGAVDALETAEPPDAAESPETTEPTDAEPTPLAPNVSAYLADTCPVVQSDLRVSTPRGTDLAKLTLDAPEALCNDGSPGIAYVRAAASDAANARWIFHLQGGGGCASHEACAARWCGQHGIYDAAKMSSRWARPRIGAPGLFRREADNPLGDWNHVFVYYCSSDTWLGRGEIDLVSADSGAAYSLHARGHHILDALLATLDAGALSDDGSVTLPPLSDAEAILWTGASAGSGGATQHLDWVAERYPAASVAGVFDAGYNPDITAFDAEVQAAFAALSADGIANLHGPADAFYDTSCVAAHADQPSACRNTNVVKRDHITTPFFQRLDLRDPTGSDNLIELGATLAQWSTAARDAMLALADIQEDAAEAAAITRAPGIYAPSCAQHIATMNDFWFARATVTDDAGADRSYRDALLAWLRGDDVVIVDTAPPSRSTCGRTTDDR